MDVKQPLPSIYDEPVSVSSQVYSSPSPGYQWNKMWHDLVQGNFPPRQEESSAARPSSSLQPSRPAGWTTDVEQPLPLIHEVPEPVSGQAHAAPSLGGQ